MKWRLKTEQELITEGWQWNEDHVFLDPPNRPRGGVYLCDDYFDGSRSFSQEDMEIIFKGGSGNCKAFPMCIANASMFVLDEPPEPLKPLCGCKWNKHPLFCKCKG